MATKENVLKLLSDSGSVEKRKSGKGHSCFLLPNGIVYSVPMSAHDHRVWDNSMSRLKQMLGEFLPEEYKPKNKRAASGTQRSTKVKKTNHHKREAFSSLTPIIVPVKTVAQQLIEAGLAEAPVPVEVRQRSIRDSYRHRVYQTQETQEQEQPLAALQLEATDLPLMKEPPLRWHDVKLPLRPKTSRLKENRICRVASEELKAEANRILNDPNLAPAEREKAYQEFMKNPQIKTKMEVTEIPMPVRKPAPVPMMEVTVKPEPTMMEDQSQKELTAAMARLQTIDEEIADAERKSFEFMTLADGLKTGKAKLQELVEFHTKRQELSKELSGFLKVPEPVATPPQKRSVPALITSKMVVEECADLLDRDGHGVDSKVIWQRFTENYPHIEEVVEKKTIGQRLAFLKTDNVIENVDTGIYRFTKQGQERYRPKKATANGHAAEAAIATTPQQSVMTH